MPEEMSSGKEPFTELEWINLQDQISKEGRRSGEENITEKFVRKAKESPLVPIGCLTTAGILSMGLYSFSKGKRELSQKMMRMRVLAQGMTIGVLMLSLFTSSMKK